MKKFFKILVVFALLGGATLSCTKDVSQDIVDLKAQDVELQGAIKALENTLSATNAAIDGLGTELGTVKTDLNTLKGNLETAIGELKGRVTATEEDIENLYDLADEATDAIADLWEAIGKANGRIDDVEGDIDDINGRIDDLIAEDIADLVTATEDLDDAINNKETGLKASIDTLAKKLGALAARIQSIVADAPVAEELTTFVFGEKKFTNLEMSFTITPASCAKGLTAENCVLVVTEGLNVTRGEAATPDANKEYKPATVTVKDGKVTVNANINAKVAEDAAVWVALRVKGQDEAGEIAKQSQFVKAVETAEPWDLFKHAAWYTVKEDTKVAGKVIVTDEVEVAWQLDSPENDKKNYMNPDFTDKDILGNYTIKLGMPDGKDWTLAAVAEKLGIADVAITAPSSQKTVINAKDEQVAETAAEAKLYTFKEEGKTVDLHIAYADGSKDSDNREFVGSKAIYAYGAKAAAGEDDGLIEDIFNWIINIIQKIINPAPAPEEAFAIKIGDQVLDGFGAVYTAGLTKNIIHSLATEDELNYKWDYVHFEETTSDCFVFEDVVWTSQLDLTEVANNWLLHGHSAVYSKEDDSLVEGEADIDKTSINTFNLELNDIAFTSEKQALYAAYKQDYRNSANEVYTSFTTEIPFTVEPKHVDVTTLLTAEDFLPVQTTGNTLTSKEKVFELVFSDTEAWLGATHTEDKITDIAEAFVPAPKALKAAKINGAAVTAANEEDFVLTLDAAKEKASVKTAAGKLKYGEKYEVEFETYPAFGVKFQFKLLVNTKAMPFSLAYTPISKDGGNVTLFGQSELLNQNGKEYWFTLEEAHFAKYIEVANADKVPATERLTLKLATPVCYQADDKSVAPADLGGVVINGPEAADFLGVKNAGAKDNADETDPRGTFDDVLTLDWQLASEKQFRGRTVKVTAQLFAGEMKVEEKDLFFHTQEPIIKVLAKECKIQRVPGEDSVIDLYKYLNITGVYDGFKASLLQAGQEFDWSWTSTKDAPFYGTNIVIAPQSGWKATLNGDEFELTSANIKVENNKVTLVRDNNPGTLEIVVPVKVTSVLDFNKPEIERVGQNTTITIVAPLGE